MMAMEEVETLPCLGCGQTTRFVMTEEQHRMWKSGVHVQTIFPAWSPEDRELLISGTCPDCWEKMWAEEEEEDEDEWEGPCEDCGWSMTNCACVKTPYVEDFSYDSDYYVDKDCD